MFSYATENSTLACQYIPRVRKLQYQWYVHGITMDYCITQHR